MCSNPTLVLACTPLSRKHHYPVCMEFILTGEASPWIGCAKEARETSHLFPLTSSSSVLSNTLLPYRFPGIPPFLHQSFHRPSVFFCTFSSIPAQLLFYLPPPLPRCSLTPLLPLLAFFQSFRHICLCTILLPNTFYELNPLSHGVFPGLGADIDLPLASSSSFALSLTALFSHHNHSECIYLSIKGISLILDEIIFRICNLWEYRNALLFISLCTR